MLVVYVLQGVVGGWGRQKAVALPLIHRVARVVAWLERLAAERLDRTEAQGSSDRFGPNDGVWRETRARVGALAAAGLPSAGARKADMHRRDRVCQCFENTHAAAHHWKYGKIIVHLFPPSNTWQSGFHPPHFHLISTHLISTHLMSTHHPRVPGAMVSQLDPDAPTRQGCALQRDNARDEDRIMAYVWRLLRAGKLDAARQLCVDCGQGWRASSLDGGGHAGPVPVGAAAEALDVPEAAAAVDAELAYEVCPAIFILAVVVSQALLQVTAINCCGCYITDDVMDLSVLWLALSW